MNLKSLIFNFRQKKFIIFLSFLLSSFALLPLLHSQELTREQILKSMAHDLSLLKSSAQTKESNLQNLQDPRLRETSEKELSALIQKIEKGKLRFLGQAAGINTDEAAIIGNQGIPSKRDVLGELQNLLIPVIDTLQRVSARPRKIEAMRRDLTLSQDKLQTLSKGMGNISALLVKFAADEELKASLQESLDQLTLQQNDIKYHIEEVESNLNVELSQEKSLMEASSDLLRGFFGQRGKNLFLSLFVFLMIGWGFWRLKQLGFPEKLITSEHLLWLKRPLSFLHGIITFAASFTGALLCLYFLNDWLLVTFFTLVLFSIIWSLKQVAPKFMKEARFVLNLGTVKEKERIIWRGIPWKVESLGLYSTLVNEDLEGGQIRVAAKDLLSEYSRVYKSGEPWFPSKKGDWVKISGLEGEILLQTPEQVVLKTRQGTKKIFPTHLFIELSPENYREAYFVESYFPFHLKYVPDMGGILEQISHKIQKKIEKHKELGLFQAQVHEVGAYFVQCYFSMRVAENLGSKRFFWQSWLNRELLISCHELGLEIPSANRATALDINESFNS